MIRGVRRPSFDLANIDFLKFEIFFELEAAKSSLNFHLRK